MTLLLLVWSLQNTSDEAVRLARAELETALGAAAEGAVVRRVHEVEWPSPALGCPEGGIAYTQVVVPGFRVVLEVDGEVHAVHVGGGRAALCERELRSVGGVERGERFQTTPEEPIDDPDDPALRKQVEHAREDLADRLSVQRDEIDLLEVESVVWPDGALGCPRPGLVYPQVQVDGVRIRLRAGKKIYHYHGGGGKDPFYCENASKGGL